MKKEQIKPVYNYLTNGHDIKLVPDGDGTYSVAVHNTSDQNAQSNLDTRRARLNSDIKFLNIETPDGTGECTHPSVVRLRTFFGGYRFWMAMTPYKDVTQENPCIYASNDGVDWIVPNGLTNPLYPAPSGTPDNYNSDTNLIYIPSTRRLRLYYREFTTTKVTIYMSESSDGVNWSDKIACTFDDNTDPIAPSVIYTDKYYMFIGRKFGFYESIDGINWSNFKDAKTNIDKTGLIWHVDVYNDETCYRMIAAVSRRRNGIASANQTQLYYATSEDMVNWVFDTRPLVAREPEGKFDERVYKSCVVWYGSNPLIYVSGVTSNYGERIAYATLVYS